MSRLLIAEFAEGDALLDAARARDGGRRDARCLLAIPVEGMAEMLGAAPTRLRLVMAIGGLGVAALLFGPNISAR